MSEDRFSDFGCIRFHISPFSRLATEVGNLGCMASDGTIYKNAFAASEQSTKAYIDITLEENGGTLPADYCVLARYLSQFVLLHALYVSAGRQVFQFTPSIITDFKRTDLSETPIGKLKLPYAAGFLHFGRQVDLKIDDQIRVSEEYVDGAYYHCGPEGQLTIQLTLSRPDGTWSKLPGPSFSISADELDHPAHLVVDKALDSDIADLNRSNFNDALRETVQEWDDATRPVVHGALSLVLNALFYLDAYGADTGPVAPSSAPPEIRDTYEKAIRSGKPKAIRSARHALMADGFSVVRMCGIGAEQNQGTGAECGGQTVRTHWRRGHWRMQPCGRQLSQVKRVWIRPTLVGKDAGSPVKGHIYSVQAPPTDRERL